MSLYQCEECGCRENTALAGYWSRNDSDSACKGRALCSACDPTIGQWHGMFERLFLPKGLFITNLRGNLAHISTGDDDIRKYAITPAVSLCADNDAALAQRSAAAVELPPRSDEPTGKESLAVNASAYISVEMPDDEGSPAQRSFWAGFESARLFPANSNIRTAWNEFKRSESFARLFAAVSPSQTYAARDVLAERRRQVEAEGWSPDHDDEHDGGELAAAAGCYAHKAAGWNYYSARDRWPWAMEWWKPSTPRRDLVKAGALILAEIERLDRAALSATQQEPS